MINASPDGSLPVAHYSLAGVPDPVGAYSNAVVFNGMVFLAGQAPFDIDGNRIGESIAEQTEATLDNLGRAAQAVGTSLSAALKVGLYLNRIEDLPVVDEIFRKRLGDHLPARTAIVAKFDGFDIEIDAILGLTHP